VLKAKLAGGGSIDARQADELKAKLKRSAGHHPDRTKDREPEHGADDVVNSELTRAAAAAAARSETPAEQLEPDELAAGLASDSADLADSAPLPGADPVEPAPARGGEAADWKLTRSTDDERASGSAVSDDSAHSARLRAIPSAAAPPSIQQRPAPWRRPDTETCEIRLWRGYTKAHFYAAEPDQGTVIGASPLFRCGWKATVRRDHDAAAAAHAALLMSLQEDGWTPARNGDDWFSVVLHRQQRPQTTS
jgi:hypothetical protein